MIDQEWLDRKTRWANAEMACTKDDHRAETWLLKAIEEINRLKLLAERCALCGERGNRIYCYGPHPDAVDDHGQQTNWSPVAWCEACHAERKARYG